ncbi:DUF6506 family protein [Ruminococcaceae bacterium OttesenSCG-928-I18]|nr:DUF6506 family protein [Ruminococcaceae bacterium OttesenSCG-928-I18]
MEWAFLFLDKKLDPALHNHMMLSPGTVNRFMGVTSVQEGCETAKKLVENGCQLIELCGGFGEEGAKEVVKAIDDAVPVAYCVYFPGGEERMKLLYD